MEVLSFGYDVGQYCGDMIQKTQLGFLEMMGMLRTQIDTIRLS
jgi:hypothetical protein